MTTNSNQPKHTPGPWSVKAYADDMVTIQQSDTGIFTPKVIVSAFDCPFDSVSEANAHLIAAAPEMLEALLIARTKLMECNAWFGDESNSPCNITSKIIADAIAKATEGNTTS